MITRGALAQNFFINFENTDFISKETSYSEINDLNWRNEK